MPKIKGILNILIFTNSWIEPGITNLFDAFLIRRLAPEFRKAVIIKRNIYL